MNNHTLSSNTAIDDTCRPRISWSAILSGALTGLGLGFLLHLFGLAIGLSAYHTSAETTTMAVGGFLGLLIGVIASMGAAGYVSGYLGRFHYSHCHGGVIYGFVTWSIALILAALVALPLTHYVSTYQRTLAPRIVVSDSMADNVDISTDNQTASGAQNKANQATTVRVSPEALTGASWIIFILFFMGALASCIGACYGMNYRKVDTVVVNRDPDMT